MLGTFLAVREVREMFRASASCERLLDSLKNVGIGCHGAKHYRPNLSDGGHKTSRLQSRSSTGLSAVRRSARLGVIRCALVKSQYPAARNARPYRTPSSVLNDSV